MSSFAATLSAAEVDALAEQFSDATAAEILLEAVERFPGRVVLTCSWQRTSSVLVHLVATQALDVRIVEVDTGLLFPETHEVRDRLIDRFGIRVETLRPRRTVAEQAADEGAELWLREPDACCGLRKVEPLERALAGPTPGSRAFADRPAARARRSGRSASTRRAVSSRWHRCGSGAPRMSRRTAPSTTFPCMRCMRRATRRSGACPARSRSRPARTSAQGAGPGRARPSAACTARPERLTATPQSASMPRARLHPRRSPARRGRAPRRPARGG